ncbi:MAG: ABC transporter substrate-binding protein [Alphaproteobacteria bacterium]|nr:ABC transporter substrate-binding protein [Alphaproteobacteria bacterium]
MSITLRAARICAALLLACLLATAARAEPKPVRVGVIMQMSGPLAAYGQETWGVFKYMIDKINAAGGIKSLGGAKIELVLADDASVPSRAANEARRLITDERVDMLAGGLQTPEMLAISPVLDELKMPTLAMFPAGSASPYLFSLNFPYDRGYAKTMADFLAWLNKDKGWHIKNVALVYSNYEAGQKVNTALKERLPKLGFNIVGEVPLDPKANDQTAAMLRLRSLKPDATVGLVRVQDGALMDQARYSLKIKNILFVGGTGGFSDEVLWHDLGDKIGQETLCKDLFGLAIFSPGSNAPALRDLWADLQKNGHFDFPLGATGISGAQGARVVQRVLENAGSTDRDKLLAALKTVNFPPGDPDLYYIRPTGLSFGEDRAPKDSTGLLIQWQPDHTQQIVYPPQLATAEPRPMQ